MWLQIRGHKWGMGMGMGMGMGVGIMHGEDMGPSLAMVGSNGEGGLLLALPAPEVPRAPRFLGTLLSFLGLLIVKSG